MRTYIIIALALIALVVLASADDANQKDGHDVVGDADEDDGRDGDLLQRRELL